MNHSPFPCSALKLLRVAKKHVGNLSILGVFGFRRAEKRLEREQSGLDGENGRPGGGEGVKADGTLPQQVSDLSLALARYPRRPTLTVWLLIFGCHTRVSNFITGGRNGYSAGILMSTL